MSIRYLLMNFSKYFALFGFVSVVMWHFTAVSCTLCTNIEEEQEEEFHRPGGEQRNDDFGEC